MWNPNFPTERKGTLNTNHWAWKMAIYTLDKAGFRTDWEKSPAIADLVYRTAVFLERELTLPTVYAQPDKEAK